MTQLNDVRSTHSLPPLLGLLDAWEFTSLRIICSARAYDAPHLPADPGDFYVGPIAPAQASRDAPRIKGAGPLVVISFSTTWMSQIEALQKTIDGLAPLGFRILVTLGPEIDPAELQVPPPVLVTSFVAHKDVLPVTDVLVTHAGHGTVMASLKAGVPMVCLPMGRDQFVNADLVVACGAGIRVNSASEVSHAVQKVLVEPAYRSRARRMALEIAREPGVGAAADAVESLAR